MKFGFMAQKEITFQFFTMSRTLFLLGKMTDAGSSMILIVALFNVSPVIIFLNLESSEAVLSFGSTEKPALLLYAYSQYLVIHSFISRKNQ